MSNHPIFSSIPLIICFQLGGPCWRICRSYTPNTTRDYCTTKGCLAYWMREDPIRYFQTFLVLEKYVRRCQQTLPYDLSKNYCFSIIFVVFLGRSQRWPLIYIFIYIYPIYQYWLIIGEITHWSDHHWSDHFRPGTSGGTGSSPSRCYMFKTSIKPGTLN